MKLQQLKRVAQEAILEDWSISVAPMSDANEIFETELAPKASGVSAAVAIEGRLIWSRQAGYAELKSKVPVVATTRFRIGSVSKPLASGRLALWWNAENWTSTRRCKGTFRIFPTKEPRSRPGCWPGICQEFVIIADRGAGQSPGAQLARRAESF